MTTDDFDLLTAEEKLARLGNYEPPAISRSVVTTRSARLDGDRAGWERFAAAVTETWAEAASEPEPDLRTVEEIFAEAEGDARAEDSGAADG